MNSQNNNNNNRMFFYMNTQNDANIHQNNSQQQQQQQQQNYYTQSQQNQYIQQLNEQMQQQVIQQNFGYNFPHSHQQVNGMIPPPGLAFSEQGGFGQNGFSPYSQQMYSQQQQQYNIHNQSRLIHQQAQIPQQNQQQNSNSYQQNQSPFQQQNPSLNQSPLQKNQQIQQQQQQSQNSYQQQQGQQKIVNKLQKQCSIQDDRITQASEEERSTSSYQHSQQSGSMEEQLLEHLELSIFKIQPCPNQNVQHNHKQCQYYHGLKDKRRVGNFYSHDPCQFIDSFGANCPLEDKCPKSHNKVEQLYRPDKYKSKFCTFYPNNCKQCEYGIFCSFAHSEKEINTELIHNYEYDIDFYIFYYKTVWCPFNYINHDRGMCVYAHNWQDYRRKPHSVEFGYEPDPCESWDPNSFITEYEIGCPNKQNCKKCHGWKELEYHPKIYRTKPCQLQPCTKGKACPNYHNNQDKRFAPKNRITKGLFKASQHLIPKEIKQHQQQGGNNNQTSGNGNVNSSIKIAQFSSSHSLSSQTNNPINNQQGFSENTQQINGTHQQVKKQTSLNNKKLKGNNVLMKMNTCIDLSTNIQEDSIEGDRHYQQFDSAYKERVYTPNTAQTIAQSPPLKKVNNKSNCNNQQQYKRCESSQFDEVATQNSTPQPQGQTNGQEEQRKQLRMTQPFALEEFKDSGKKTAPNDSFSSLQNLSAIKQFNSDSGYNQAQQQNQSEYYVKDQLDMMHSPYNQFDNAFNPQMNNRNIQRSNTQPIQEIGDSLNQTNPNFNQQFGVQFDNNNFTKIPSNLISNNQNYQNISQQQKNSKQSANKNNFSNTENTNKSTNENQDDEDYDQINALIHNIL